MSYKSILVHVDQSPHADTRIRVAAQIAAASGAHLIGAAMTGVARFMYQTGAVAYAGPSPAASTDFLYLRASQALDQFDAIASANGVRTFEKQQIDDDEEDGLVLQSRYSDLVVVSQHNLDTPPPGAVAHLPEYVMLNGARPVLMVPHAGRHDHIGRRPLVAWDGSTEATRAITGALPLLRRASAVALAVFNPAARVRGRGEQPAADMARYLARQDVHVEVIQQRTSIDVGNALLSMAADIDADLLVMGGYGHSRFRELLLGGVTQTILKSMTLPVLMAH